MLSDLLYARAIRTRRRNIVFWRCGEVFWLVKTDASGNFGGVESGLAWVDSSANTITLCRVAKDTYWNYVRLRLWKPRALD